MKRVDCSGSIDLKKQTRCVAALAVLLVSGAAQAELFDRGGGRIYDSVQDITWLADWNHAKSSGHDADGRMNWGDAVSWADSLSYGGYSDWRLPSGFNADGSGPCQGIGCSGSEMGHLFNVEWGVAFGSSFRTGDPAKLALFQNIQADWYWAGTLVEEGGFPVFFNPEGGGQGNWYPDQYKWILQPFAVVVRDGDVGVIPEPTMAAMLLLGLGGLMLAVRRQRLP